MSLKQLIKRKEILKTQMHSGISLTLPGEPLLYSVKYTLGKRRLPVQFFRNKKFMSLIRCYFPAYRSAKTPVVLIVGFYVSPFRDKAPKLSLKKIRSEEVPAVYSWELCDILLSFLEMIFHAVLGSYRQIVKIDVCKFYSDNPRTVFQFLHWDNYVNLQNHYSLDAQSESVGKVQQPKGLQCKRSRHGTADEVRTREPARDRGTATVWATDGDSALQVPIAESDDGKA